MDQTTTVSTPLTNFLTIRGMTCGHCVARVTRALSSVEGVKVLDVSIGAATLAATSDSALQAAVAAVEDLGYQASAMTQTAPAAPAKSCCGGGSCGG